MAKKNLTSFKCTKCGHLEPKWSGRCNSCGEWNTFQEITPVKHPRGGSIGVGGIGGRAAGGGRADFFPLNEVQLRDNLRIRSGIQEFDRVLGDGVLQGSSVLLGGEPGIGKSTLMLQAAAAYGSQGNVLYISGEEAPEQIKLRAVRLGIQKTAINILSTSRAEECVNYIVQTKPVVIIVDSIQTLFSSESSSTPGSPSQVTFSVQLIVEAARAVHASSFFIAHVTKEGIIAGPKLIEHLVDAVLFFDHSDDELRFLRASKNRFGSTGEIGLFSMEEDGLQEMTDTEKLFLSGSEPSPGSAIVPVYEGSRIFMIEIQALVIQGKEGFSRVYSDKIDQRRVNRIAAVLEKHAGIKLSDQDVYINVAGGIRLNDVGAELALALSLYSARTGINLPVKSAFCGELSLSGKIRPVSHLKRRASQARELGFSPLILSGGESGNGIITVGTIGEAVKAVLNCTAAKSD
ncbi:MAG: DNA repair protein RadA [Salinispira sp.]